MLEKVENGALYTGCGLDYIVLANGYNERTRKGQNFYSINNQSQLHEAIADWIVTADRTIQGQDVRFLRSVMGLSGAALAIPLGVVRETIHHWEKRGNAAIPKHGDRAIRMYYAHRKNNQDFTMRMTARLHELDDAREREIERLVYEGEHWQPQKAKTA